MVTIIIFNIRCYRIVRFKVIESGMETGAQEWGDMERAV